MKRVSIKQIIFIVIFLILALLFFYGRSFVPKEIDISYKGIMYNEEAYETGDYENLNIRETTVHIRGELHRPWFKEPYIVGYIDTDVAAVDETEFHPEAFWAFEKTYPIVLAVGRVQRLKTLFMVLSICIKI